MFRSDTLRAPAVQVATCLVLLLSSRPLMAQGAPEGAAQTSSFDIAPRAYLQLDWRGYPDWTLEPGAGRLRFDTFEVRRARLGIDGRWRRVSFEVAFDPQDLDEDAALKDAYGEVRVSRGLQVRLGQFKLPGGLEYQTSARTLDFMERSAMSFSAQATRDLGAMASGDIGTRLEYEVGVFAGDGRGRASRSGVTTAARVAWTPVSDLEFGAASSVGRTAATDSAPANGLGGVSTSGYRFFDRVYVQGRRQRVQMDVAFTPRAWTFSAEAIHATDERLEQGLDFEDLPSVVARGWSAAVSHTFGRRRGVARVRTREIDLSVRFDRLGFDDSAAATDRDSVRPRATDVRARSANTVTVGVSWQPTRWSRVLGNASLERYGDSRSSPDAGRHGPYFTVGTRLQIELP